MSVQSRSLSGGAAGLIDYYGMAEDELATYYAETSLPGSSAPDADDSVVFRGAQVSGRAAVHMGLALKHGMAHDVSVADLRLIADGRHVQTGEALTRHRAAPVYERDASGRYRRDDQGNKVRRLDRHGKPMTKAASLSGIDLTASAPKSVSIAVAVADGVSPAMRDAILNAHRIANAELLAYVQDNARLGKRTVATPTEAREFVGAGGPRLVTKGERAGEATRMQGSRTERCAVDLAFFTVTQHTSRPTQETVDRGAPPDMSLHSHNLIARSGFDSTTGRWTTIDEYGLKQAMAAAAHDGVYMGALHREVVAAGVPIEYGDFHDARHGRMPWRIKGITEEAEQLYSSNHRRIPEVVKEWEAANGRVASPAMVNRLMHETKLAKDDLAKAQDRSPDYALWREDAARAGVTLATPDLIQALRAPDQRLAREDYEARRAELWERLDGPNGLTMANATFTAPEAASALARCAEGLDFTRDELDGLELEVLARTVPLDPYGPDGKERDPRVVRRTTRVQMDRELRIAAALHQKAAATYPAATASTIEATLTAQPRALDAEQVGLVEAVASGRGVVFVDGHAGAGKTTALRTAVDALRSDGAVQRVYVVSTASRTAKDSGAKLSADAAGSIESLSHRISTGTLPTPDHKTLIVVDESYMVDTGRMDQLLAVSGSARIVYAGDDHQAQPIGPAGWYHDAIAQHGKAQTLTSVHRHVDEADAAAFRMIREGQPQAALEDLDRRGRVHVSEDSQATFDLIASDYRRHRDDGLSSTEVRVVTDRSNHDVDALNRLVQNNRLQAGELSAEGVSVEATKTGRGWTIYADDPVIFIDGYRNRKLNLTIANGTAGRAIAVDPAARSVTVALDKTGDRVTIPLEEHAAIQPLAPAYAVHTQKFQGAEERVILYVPAAPEQVDKFRTYSSLTRATHEAHIYVDEETHGERAMENLAESLTGGVFPQSAQSVARGANRSISVADVARTTPITSVQALRERRPVTKAALTEAREEARMTRLRAVVGPEVAKAVQKAPALPTLMGRLNELDRGGANANAMLRTAARSGPLDGARDPAAVLVSRLDQTPRISRDAVRKETSREPDGLTPTFVERRPGQNRAAEVLDKLQEQQQRGPHIGHGMTF